MAIMAFRMEYPPVFADGSRIRPGKCGHRLEPVWSFLGDVVAGGRNKSDLHIDRKWWAGPDKSASTYLIEITI
jgi:hypothetical protein